MICGCTTEKSTHLLKDVEGNAKSPAEQLGDGGCFIIQGFLVAPEHSTPQAVPVRDAPGRV